MRIRTTVIATIIVVVFGLVSCQQGSGGGQAEGGESSQQGEEESSPAGGTLAQIQERGTVRVGMAQTTPGAYKDIDSGEWTGIHVDVAQELADQLGVELEIVETSWEVFLPALNEEEFDVYMPGTFYTGQRSIQAAYTEPAYYKGVSAIVRSDNNRFDSVEDFNDSDVTIAVRLGAVEAELGPQFFPEAEFNTFDTDEAPTVAQAVRVGNADVWLADEVLQRRYAEENDWAEILGEPIGSHPISYVVRYGEPDWLAYMDRFVGFMHSSGQMRIFVERYGQDPSTLTY